ncbi:iron-containing alcohol dehydrogenase [Aminipila luticellarii]|uniref:Iron-containing alcohol dehydrogenase n=1 Tax=Aminipila luticellarii TaxID=2507160 RepID=A0A410PS79_9FIRM|nr:iron-containing alcohol dehydrogenase [Aminipila luticellarii]QAT41746.1 iron-containing alcohol dehydrogenase [Aminipila luticellarii]
MINFEFSMSTQIIFGRGAQLKVGQLVNPYGKKVLLHYGSDRIEKNGVLEQLISILKGQGIKYRKFGGVKSNPDVELAQQGAKICKEEKIDMILAIGGGSVIDSAKAIAVGSCTEQLIWDIYKNSLKVQEALPIGAVVTIPASASESNAMSVLSNYGTHEKKAFYCRKTLPKFAVLNPEYTVSLSAYNTAVTAIDIFSHAFERYFDLRRDSFLWDSMCESVMKAVIQIAPEIMKKPQDYELRSEMMWAASVAHNNMLGPGGDFASHGLAHVLTAEYGLPHGAALAVIMPAWCRYIIGRHEKKFQTFGRNVWNVDSGEKAIQAFIQFIQKLGLASDFKLAGIKNADINRLASLACEGDALTLGGGIEEIDKRAAAEIYKIANETVA